MDIKELDTPAVVIDEAIVDRNIKAAQELIGGLGMAMRPHVKTHKLPLLARRQLDAGAIGITCQKISEAEVFADNGCDDILISYNILGQTKLKRLKALAEKARLTVVADNDVVVDGLGRHFTDSQSPLSVLIECETGLNRCGVTSPAAARDLARAVMGHKGLHLAGLMTYPVPGEPAKVQDILSRSREVVEAAAGPIDVVSSGGTAAMGQVNLTPVVTEFRPGTYIYNDRHHMSRSVCSVGDCALMVLSRVISRPSDNRVVIDAGSKSLTSDLMGLTGHGMIREYPAAVINGLSEEHGHVDISRCVDKPKIGELVGVIPNHACPVSNLYDTVHLHKNGKITQSLPVAARGCVY